MNGLIIPLSVVYAGLAGTLLALLVATAFNRWSPKVFFLLALRLAIGWHFLFEGLYKVNSHYAGPSESTKPFSSELYFRAAPGPIGGYMRKQFDDPAAVIAEKVKPPHEIDAAKFKLLPVAEQAAACPAAVAQQLDQKEATAAIIIRNAAQKELDNVDVTLGKELKKIDKEEAAALKDAQAGVVGEIATSSVTGTVLTAVGLARTDNAVAAIKAKFDDQRKKAEKQAKTTREDAPKRSADCETTAHTLVTEAKAAYARWVYGVEGRGTKVKYLSGDQPALTAPERLAHIEWLKGELAAAEARQTEELGNGYAIDSKHVAELRADLIAAESDLAKDANAFVAELKKDLGGAVNEEDTQTSNGQWMDRITMWFLVAVGACLMFGLFTRLACVLAAGFLVMTYLAHPPFPWYPQPPNTEGNPVFINKNVIECLALLSLACLPTGRWLGLDALVLRPFCRYKGECCAKPAAEPPPATRAAR